MKFTRRDFLATTAAGSAALALDVGAQNKPEQGAAPAGALPKKPVIICAHNGYNYLDRGYAVLTSGGDTLDAIMQVITGWRTIRTTPVLVWAVCQMKIALSSLMPAACTARPAWLVRWPLWKRSRTFRHCRRR